MNAIIKLVKQHPFFLLLLTIAALLRISYLNYNSVFIDEAIYIVLGQKILSLNLHDGIEAFSWVGGMPFIYPVFSAFFYNLGGIFLSRFANATLGAISVFLFYQFALHLSFYTKNHLNILASRIAALIFATSAIPITLSRISIYDMLSFTFFLAGLVTLGYAYYKKGRWAFLSSLLFLLSVFSKYITAIYIPFLIIFVVITAMRSKTEKLKITLIKEFCFPLIIGIIGYTLYTYQDLYNFYFSNAVSNSSYIQIIENFVKPSGIIIMLSLLGIVFVFNKRNLRLISTLVIASCVPLLFHFVGKNASSATQHSFLSLIFLLPFSGALVATLIDSLTRTYQKMVIALVVILNFMISFPVITQEESFWPNSTQAENILRLKVTSNDYILAEGGDIYALALEDIIPESQVSGPFVYEYNGIEGIQAYLSAIDESHFKYIQLEGTYFPQSDIEAIKQRIEGRYSPILTDGPISVYELNP